MDIDLSYLHFMNNKLNVCFIDFQSCRKVKRLEFYLRFSITFIYGDAGRMKNL